MKRILGIILATFMLVCCFNLVGCIGPIGATGEYEFSSMTDPDGNTYKAGEKYEGIELDEDYFVVELFDDGTCELQLMGFPVEGTYEINLINIKMDFGYAGEFEGTIIFGTIIIKEDGGKIVLKK